MLAPGFHGRTARYGGAQRGPEVAQHEGDPGVLGGRVGRHAHRGGRSGVGCALTELGLCEPGGIDGAVTLDLRGKQGQASVGV